MEVEIEATAVLFDHVDGWQGRRCFRPMDVPSELEDVPVPEEWIGGGQVVLGGRRLVWRSRGAKLELAEMTSRDQARNGMELPFPVLSRDAICFEEVTGDRDECMVMWALTRDLVLHAVPFKSPMATAGQQHQQQHLQLHQHDQQQQLLQGAGGVPATSLLAALPSPEACHAVALRPPQGSRHPSCCSFLTPRDLLIGYSSGKVQLLRVTRERGEGGGVGGPARPEIHVEVVRELPAAGYLSYLNPLSYRQTAQPVSSPVIAVAGHDFGRGAELLVFSLHADRKLRIWQARSKGQLVSELPLVGAVDRGLLYSGCSKLMVYQAAGGSCRVVVSLTEPSYSRIWVSKAFSTSGEVEAWKERHLAAHCFEESQLVADVGLVPDGGEGGRGGGRGVGRGQGGAEGSRLRLWAALADDGLAYAVLDDKAKAKAGAGAGAGAGGRLTRLWQAPPSGLEDIGTLLPLPAVAGAGRKENKGSQREALRQSLLQLHLRLGSQWDDTVRHIEASFLRVLAAPSRFSSMALMKAVERMRSAPLGLVGGAGSGRGNSSRGSTMRSPRGRTTSEGEKEVLLVGERLWEMVVGVVRKEADQAMAEVARQQPYHHERKQEENKDEAEKKAQALLSAWLHFLDLAEQSRELMGQPLGLVLAPVGPGAQETAPAAPALLRLDRFSQVAEVRLPLGRTSLFLEAFDRWLAQAAPSTALALNQALSETIASQGQLPDPVQVKRLAAEALQRRPSGLDAGLVLTGATHNEQIELATAGYQAVEEIQGVLEAFEGLLQVRLKRGRQQGQQGQGHRRSSSASSPGASMQLEEAEGQEGEGGRRKGVSTTMAALGAAALREILSFSVTRLRSSLLLLVHLEVTGLQPQQQVLWSAATVPGSLPEPPLALQVAAALNRAWLLCYSGAQAQLPPAPIRIVSSIGSFNLMSAGAAAFRTGLPVLEAMFLSAQPQTQAQDLQSLVDALCQSLPHRLMSYLEKTEQYRYLLAWARSLLEGALLLPSTLPYTPEGQEAEEAAVLRWQRLVVYAYLSEARRVAPRDVKAGEALFSLAVKALKEWDTCLAPHFLLADEGGELGAGGGGGGGGGGEDDESIPTNCADLTQVRLAHYLKAVGLLEQSVGPLGCSARRLADLAYAGLRHVPTLPEDLPSPSVDAAAWLKLKWCLKHAAALWATVFRACTDHTPLSPAMGNMGKEGEGAMLVTQEEEGERSKNDAAGLATMMTDGAFQEAFLAMRAELSVAHDLEELTEHEMKDQGMGAEAGSSASIAAAEAKVQAIRRNKNSKLSYLIVELCEQGRIDLVCSLPWAEEDAEDEISEIEKCLRSSARFSTLGDGDEEDFPATSRTGRGRGRGGMSLEAPPVDYYKAAYAFLVMHSNYRMAALEMYRLAKRLEDSTVYEDSVQRLERKIDALSAAHNCLCILQESGEYPCVTFNFDDSGKALHSGSGGSSGGSSSRRTCLVTLKRVEQELTYALAAKQYLLVAGAAGEGGGGGGGGDGAAGAAVAAPWRPLALVLSHPGTGEGKATKAMLHQIETASAQLCAVGLYESAVALVKAFGLPMNHIVASLAKTFVMLRSGRADAPMVVEDGPRWNWGDPEEELSPEEHGGMGGMGGEREEEEARRRVYLRLVQRLAEGGEEERVVAEHAEAAGWLLKDIVQGYDWAHAFELHTEAARYILACDSFFEMPRWLTRAFTRGVDVRLVKKTNKKGGNNEAAAYVDRTTGRKLLPAANSGAFLQMHVDKAVYLVSSSPTSQMRRGEGIGAPPPPVAEGLLQEALYLLVQGLGFAMDLIDALNEQIAGQSGKLWLPRTALLALVERTRECVKIGSASEGVAKLKSEAEEKVKLLKKRLTNAELQVQTLQQSAAITGGGGGQGWLY